MEKALNRFEFRKALQTILSAVDHVNAYIDKTKPWKLHKESEDESDQLIFLLVNMLKSITITFSPYIPFSSSEVFKALGIENYAWDDAKSIDYTLSGRHVNNVKLYRKIETKQIEELVNLLKRRTEQKDYIEYDEFAKVQLRVAKVLSAQRIKGSNKLLLLKVSLGDEERQIVAGIGKVYEPDELVGKNIVIVANLKPKKLMGYESQGMLLAAGDKPVLIVPEKEVKPGTKIS